MATALAFHDPAHEQAHQFHVRLNHFNSIRLLIGAFVASLAATFGGRRRDA